MTVVHTVKNDTHPLPGSDKGGNANHVSDQRQDTPSTSGTAEGDEDGSDKTEGDDRDTKTASKDDTRTVAVADGPANEVWVSLTTESVLDWLEGGTESRWVSCGLKSV